MRSGGANAGVARLPSGRAVDACRAGRPARCRGLAADAVSGRRAATAAGGRGARRRPGVGSVWTRRPIREALDGAVQGRVAARLDARVGPAGVPGTRVARPDRWFLHFVRGRRFVARRLVAGPSGFGKRGAVRAGGVQPRRGGVRRRDRGVVRAPTGVLVEAGDRCATADGRREYPVCKEMKHALGARVQEGIRHNVTCTLGAQTDPCRSARTHLETRSRPLFSYVEEGASPTPGTDVSVAGPKLPV